jgi:hypothetical protein
MDVEFPYVNKITNFRLSVSVDGKQFALFMREMLCLYTAQGEGHRSVMICPFGEMGGRRELEGGDLNYKMFSIAARSCWFLPILADVKFP